MNEPAYAEKRFFAAHGVLLNSDSYPGSRLGNLKLHEPDGKLSLIPWDDNLAFGTFLSAIGFEHREGPTRLMNRAIDTLVENRIGHKLSLASAWNRRNRA